VNLIKMWDEQVLKWFGLNSLSIQLDITNACNLRCTHCYHPDHKNSGNLQINDWIQVLAQYQSLLRTVKARPNIAICGGEPLISPVLFPMLDEITRRWNNTFIGIMTNGTQIDRHLDRLKQYPLFFQVSLESSNPTHHDAIRGIGSFERVLDGIRVLLASGFDVHLLVILSRKTAAEIEGMFAFAKELGVKSLNYTRAIPEGAGKSHFELEDSVLVKDELKRAITDVVHASRKFAVPTNTDKPLFSLVDKNSGTGGKAGYQGLVVGYRGEIKASSRASLILGNVKRDSLESVYFNHDLYRSLRRGEVLKCGKCKFYRKCGGDRNFAYATTANFLGPDNGCWIN